MIGYDDKTFCISPGCKNRCGRKLTPEIERLANEWWVNSCGGNEDSAPIACAYFCGGKEEAEEDNAGDYNA